MFINKNFFFLWLGRVISNAGDSLYLIVLSWYILKITDQAFWVGFLNFAIFLPTIFQFVFGPTIDRNIKRRLLIICEVGQMISILILVIIISFDINHPLIISLLAFLAATFGVNTYTIQDVLIPKIVEKKDLVKGQSYMSIAYMGTEYLFNALSGFLIKIFSTTLLLAADVITFLLAIICFKQIKITEKIPQKTDSKSITKDSVFSSFKIIFNNKSILVLTLASTVANFLFGGLNVYTALIAYNQDSPVLYGVLMSIAAVGSLVGSTIVIHILKKWFNYGKIFVFSTIFFGGLILIAGFAVNNISIVVPFFFAFIFLGITQVINKVYYQSLLDSAILGKVMSGVYTISIGSLPLGSLLFGAIGNIFSPGLFLITFGFIYMIIGLVYLYNKTIFKFKIDSNSYDDTQQTS